MKLDNGFGPKIDVTAGGKVEQFADQMQQTKILGMFKSIVCPCGCPDIVLQEVYGVKYNPLKIGQVSVEPRQRMSCADCGDTLVLAKNEQGEATGWEFHPKERDL